MAARRLWSREEFILTLNLYLKMLHLNLLSMKKLLLSLVCFITSIVCNAQTLYIYGGSDHDVFLGCLNSNKYDS